MIFEVIEDTKKPGSDVQIPDSYQPASIKDYASLIPSEITKSLLWVSRSPGSSKRPRFPTSLAGRLASYVFSRRVRMSERSGALIGSCLLTSSRKDVSEWDFSMRRVNASMWRGLESCLVAKKISESSPPSHRSCQRDQDGHVPTLWSHGHNLLQIAKNINSNWSSPSNFRVRVSRGLPSLGPSIEALGEPWRPD